MADIKYNGWSNYETWNIVLWLQNSEKYYFELKKVLDHYKTSNNNHPKFNLYSSWLVCTSRHNKSTPDNVAWNSKKVNVEEVNEALQEFLDITKYEYNNNERSKHE